MDIKTILKWLFLPPAILLGLALLLILPLLVLIKGTMMSWQAEFSYESSLLIGGLAAFVVLFTYLVAVDRIAGRQIFFNPWIKLGIAATVVVSFVLWTLYVVNDENVKNRRIASQYTKAHPVLRLGVSTWSIFDTKLVITDIARDSSFYRRRRMRVFHRSLHFPQKYLDGKVYAFDIRTKRRSKFRNWLTETTFRMMGFSTLRHVGTADHLHVELPLRKSDKRKIRVARRALRKKYLAWKRKKRRRLLAAKRKRERRARALAIQQQKALRQAQVPANKNTQPSGTEPVSNSVAATESSPATTTTSHQTPANKTNDSSSSPAVTKTQNSED